MQRSELPQGWGVTLSLPDETEEQYEWTAPDGGSIPDVYVCKLDEDWEIEYWISNDAIGNGATWMTVLVPLTPNPPFELAEALYYAAQ